MGNTESNVTSGVKKQAGAAMQPIYKLCDLKGGGLLVELMKRATQNKQYAEIDHAIKTKVEHFLYNKGAGRYIPISQMVLLRNKERARHKLLPQLKGMENPDEFEVDDEGTEISEEEYRKNPSKYRPVCWKLKERGAVGETIMHLCLLNATSLHADIAKRLLRFYPNLIWDIYISDEYYGENVLHIAIVNEDPSMVKFLLAANVNIQERCFGNFMCPEDQKSSRFDSLDHEWVNVCPETNYDGYVYWGEYPLSFAACLGQEESFRLILAKGADLDAQDTNGNTILHLLVIYSKVELFDMAYEVGASLPIKNVQNLTPLTLTAKLARSITCAAYPLSQIDTIDTITGQISKTSALNLVVFGVSIEEFTFHSNSCQNLLSHQKLNQLPLEKTHKDLYFDKDEHLELLDGVLVDLLNAKWNTFVKFKFYRQFFTFAFYFIISLIDNMDHNDDDDYDVEEWWDNLQEECRLMNLDKEESQVRFAAEIGITFGAFFYLAAAVREARFLGLRMFFENLMTAPSRVMFLFSCILVFGVIPWLRLLCLDEIEDVIAVVVMLTTAPYFLFFCRGFKTVGPFVVMIYRMVMGDLLRFAAIYMVFVMGFSQAYYIIFLSFDNPLTPEDVDDSKTNPMSTPAESIMAMFLMSMTNFGDYYNAFARTEHEYEAKRRHDRHVKKRKDKEAGNKSVSLANVQEKSGTTIKIQQ
ncbi:unnamed protein product [Ceutorhynchus assimilis]|uniref:Transient receptor potential cation channel subfamily V member 5 n=1 Tax=Ceutorhynchus assimilis TaxID=467358 RepID=A0A9N9MP43_9CUCU|nr:unnamed protein product [Ceutorhynchus assimilis]